MNYFPGSLPSYPSFNFFCLIINFSLTIKLKFNVISLHQSLFHFKIKLNDPNVVLIVDLFHSVTEEFWSL